MQRGSPAGGKGTLNLRRRTDCSQDMGWGDAYYGKSYILKQKPGLTLICSYSTPNCCLSVAVMSTSLWPHGLQHPRLSCLLEFAQTHVHWVGDAIQPSHPLSCLSPPALNFSQLQGLLQWVRWSQYWNFSVSPSSEYSGLISFKTDWFDLLAVQGTLKSHIQHHRSETPILPCLVFFMIQLSDPYKTTGKTIALTIWTFSHSQQSEVSAF